jgi:hypothetical protein
MNIRGSPNRIIVSNKAAFIGSTFYGNVPLDEYMNGLYEAIPTLKLDKTTTIKKPV